MPTELDEARSEAEITKALAAALGQLVGDMLIGYSLQSGAPDRALAEARAALDANVAKFSFLATLPDGATVDATAEIKRRIAAHLDRAEDFARRKLALPPRASAP